MFKKWRFAMLLFAALLIPITSVAEVKLVSADTKGIVGEIVPAKTEPSGVVNVYVAATLDGLAYFKGPAGWDLYNPKQPFPAAGKIFLPLPGPSIQVNVFTGDPAAAPGAQFWLAYGTSDSEALKNAAVIYTVPIIGCMDKKATNYNPKATSQEGATCAYPVVIGCMDKNATNYNPEATTQEGVTCTYPAPTPAPAVAQYDVYALWTHGYPYTVGKGGASAVTNSTPYSSLLLCYLGAARLPNGRVPASCQDPSGARHQLEIDSTTNVMTASTADMSGVSWVQTGSTSVSVSDGTYAASTSGSTVSIVFQGTSGTTTVASGTVSGNGQVTAMIGYQK